MAIFNGNDNAILRSNKNLDERQLNDKIKTLSASYRITEIITYTLLIIVFIYSVTSTISGIFISTSDNFGILDSTWITNGILIPVYSLIWLVVGIIEIPIFVFKWNKNPVKED